jgi:hypothetical protein
MAKFAIQYRKAPGEYGSFVIEESGLCLRADVAGIEAGIVSRFKLIPIPNAAGFVFKVLDGTQPAVTRVRPSTYDAEYECVKISGTVNPYAAAQDGGPLQGQTVMLYEIRWQTVGVAS